MFICTHSHICKMTFSTNILYLANTHSGFTKAKAQQKAVKC